MGKTAVKSFFHYLLAGITCLLAIATVMAGWCGHVHPADSRLLTLLGLALPVLLIINLLVALCWAFGRSRWAFVPLAAFLLNWSYLSATYQLRWQRELPPEATVDDGMPNDYLTLFTYNIQNFGGEITGYSCKELARYLENEHADILCFQEFSTNQEFPLDSVKKVLARWPHCAVSSEDTDNGTLPIALFSRYPLAYKRYITYDGSSNSSMMCDVVWGKDTLRILNNHLQTTNVNQSRRKLEKAMKTEDSRREAEAIKNAAGTLQDNFVKRAAQADSVCRYIETSPYPLLVCGDLNSIPSSYVYHRLNALLKDGFKSAGNGYMYTYRNAKHLLRIDYIFHSPELTAVRYLSPDMDLCSDHNPVLMTVSRKKER